MTGREQNEIRKIREEYEDKEPTEIDKIRELDRECKRVPQRISYILGGVGTLMLGAGMCLAMPTVISGFMPLGIAVGLVGIAAVSVNYPLYKRLLKKRREKIKDKVLALADRLEGGEAQVSEEVG